jgi:hypothetical protein
MCFARKVAIYPNIKKASEEKQQKKKRKISSRTVFKAFFAFLFEMWSASRRSDNFKT